MDSKEPYCSRAKRVAEADSSCRRLIVSLFRDSSRFESLDVSHHSRFTCERNKEEINDDDSQDHQGGFTDRSSRWSLV